MRASVLRPIVAQLALTVAAASASFAQTAQTAQPQAQPVQAAAPAPAMTRDAIVAFAKTQLAVAKLRDSARAQLVLPQNLPDDTQKKLRAELRSQIAAILKQNGMTDEEFRRKTYLVSSDNGVRATFDTVVSQITGIPLPTPLPATTPVIKVPGGPVGLHIGHVVNGYRDTPGEMGLLPTAFAEAKIAIQHAQLAAKMPTNLDAMKAHAGHVINAVDPSIIPIGPGMGYGVKKAALGVAMHIELAAKANAASANVIGHSVHVAMAARSTAQRADEVVALAQRIQAATSAADAAPLVTQLVTLTQQLISGVDANGDGRITWEQGEGGLQQAQDHVNLMLAGEHLPPG